MNDIVTKSIRPFIGSKDYQQSLLFYKTIGFQIASLSDKMSVLKLNTCYFYLQDYYAADWIDNSMIFLELEQSETYLEHLKSLNLTMQFPSVKLSVMVHNDWGKEFFLHDPSGVLWHIGSFEK